MTSGAPNTNDDFCIEENFDRMRSDDKYNECNFIERPTRNPSVSVLLDKSPKLEQKMKANSKVVPLEDDQIEISEDDEKIESQGLNNSKEENASSNDEMKDKNQIKYKNAVEGGKKVTSQKTGLIDFSMLQGKND